MLRVNGLLKREIGEIFERLVRGRVSGLVTITDIKTAPDLRTAIVYVSVYGSDEQKERAMHVLSQERKEIQRLISHRVKLKFTPVLDFRLDEHLDKADRIFQIIEGLKPAATAGEGQVQPEESSHDQDA